LGKKIETNEFFIVENYRGIEKGLEGLHNSIDEVLKMKNNFCIISDFYNKTWLNVK
jgi:hypothetical protein